MADETDPEGTVHVHVDVVPPEPEPEPEPAPEPTPDPSPSAADVAALIDAERRATEAESARAEAERQLTDERTRANDAYELGRTEALAAMPEPEPEVIVEPEPEPEPLPSEEIEPVSAGVHWWYKPMRDWKIFGGGKQ